MAHHHPRPDGVAGYVHRPETTAVTHARLGVRRGDFGRVEQPMDPTKRKSLIFAGSASNDIMQLQFPIR